MQASTITLFGIDRPAAGLAARMALSAVLAFSIAAFLHVNNAYWAAMPVWVVAQSSRGLLLERGFYRLVGTVIGAAAGFAMLGITSQPYLLLAMLGVWVALGSGLTHMLRGVQSYGALLAGMTAAVVVLPSLHAAEHAQALAIARVECTLIGVVVVTLITGFFTPRARQREYYVRVRQLAADAAGFAADAISGRPAPHTAELERRVLHDMSNVESMAHTVAAGSIEGYRRLPHSVGLIAASLSLMAAATSLRARRERGEPVPADLAPRLDALSKEMRTAAPAQAIAPTPWTSRDVWGPEARIHESTQRLIAAEQALFAAGRGQAMDEASKAPYRAYFQPQRDWRRARIGGLTSGSATFAAAAIGYASGWPAAELAALGVCIFSMVLGTIPTARAVAPKMIVGVCVGVALAAFYRFVIQPHVAGPVSLIVSVAPFMVAGAMARVVPRTMMPALDANMCFMLGSQAGMPAVGAADILNGSAALLLAAMLVAGTLVLAPDATGARLRALAAGIRRDVSRLLDARCDVSAREWHARTGRRLLRLLLDLQRAGRAGEAPAGLLATLNLGHAIAGLQGHATALAPDSAEARHVGAVLDALRQFPDDPVRAADNALDASSKLPDTAIAQTVQDAAAALREGAALLGHRWLANSVS